MSPNQCAPAKLDRANVTYRSIHVSVTLGHRAMDYWSTFVHSQTPNKKCEENGTNWIFSKSGYVGSFEKVSFNKFHYHIWKLLGNSLFPTRGFNSPKRLWRNVQICVQSHGVTWLNPHDRHSHSPALRKGQPLGARTERWCVPLNHHWVEDLKKTMPSITAITI